MTIKTEREREKKERENYYLNLQLISLKRYIFAVTESEKVSRIQAGLHEFLN